MRTGKTNVKGDLRLLPEWVRDRCVIDGGCICWTKAMSYLTPIGSPPGRPGSGPVHRWVFEVVNGVHLDKWQQVRRSCGNKRCVRPGHLVLRECEPF